VPADKFIRIAENSGLIIPIGEWVLRTARSQRENGRRKVFPICLWRSTSQPCRFRQEGFCELIRSVFHETDLAAQCLELEVTESLL